MAKISSLKGFPDILPSDSWKWQAVESIARQTASLYHYQEIRTPLLEDAALFHRGVGETSDIVKKETYTFTDRDGSDVTLRPEGTAGVVRAVIEAGLLNDQGARAKVFYIGPNFRHERPQKGRVRQHHQFGVEAFGIPTPDQDVECIQLQMDFYRRAGLRDLSLNVNSLGDRDSKQRYRDALVAFLSPKSSALSEDSQRRLESNPLRILDSKDPRDVAAIQGAPPAVEYLSDKSRQHFDRVQQLLKFSNIPFIVEGSLVRGFDYYTDTLWEVTAAGLGSQSAVGGGGRYDNLVEQLGGRPTPGVGFGSGLERLLIALEEQNIALPNPTSPLVWIATQVDAARDVAWQLLEQLRANNISADTDLTGRSLKAQFKLADREKAAWCIVIGESELASSSVVLKNFANGEQLTLPQSQLVARLTSTTPPAKPL